MARRFTAGLAFAVGMITAGPAGAGQSGQPALVLHIDNYARVPWELLTRAELEAARIFADAGIRTAWIHDDQRAGRTAGANRGGRAGTARRLRVLLLCQEMSQRKISVEGIGDRVLGRAGRAAARAYIFTPRVLDAARSRGDFAVALGRVVAHEVGHLVLPPDSHSLEGIMRRSPDLFSRRSDGFTEAQRRQIQEELRW